jgi:hypothetical protein
MFSLAGECLDHSWAFTSPDFARTHCTLPDSEAVKKYHQLKRIMLEAECSPGLYSSSKMYCECAMVATSGHYWLISLLTADIYI